MDWGWVIGSKGGEWVELGSCEVEEERNNEWRRGERRSGRVEEWMSGGAGERSSEEVEEWTMRGLYGQRSREAEQWKSGGVEQWSSGVANISVTEMLVNLTSL